MKDSKPHNLDGDDGGIKSSMPNTSKGPKLVIRLGSQNKIIACSPQSNASSCQNEQYLTTSIGNEGLVQLGENENSERNDTAAILGDGKGHKVDHMDQNKGQNHRDGSGPYPPLRTFGILGKRSNEGSVITGAGAEVPATKDNKLASVKHAEAGPAFSDDLHDEKNSTPSVSNSARKDPKPLLKLKFKNPYHESQNVWASPGEEEKSKRKRAPAFVEKTSTRSDDNSS